MLMLRKLKLRCKLYLAILFFQFYEFGSSFTERLNLSDITTWFDGEFEDGHWDIVHIHRQIKNLE